MRVDPRSLSVLVAVAFGCGEPSRDVDLGLTGTGSVADGPAGTSSGAADSTGSEPSTGTLAETSEGGSTGTPSDATDASSGSTTGAAQDDTLIGWAAVEGDGVGPTVGGEGGQVVTVDSIEDLQSYAAMAEPVVIQISGVLTGDVSVASDKTLEGMPGAEIHGQIALVGAAGDQRSNVIIRNLTLVGNACEGGCQDRDVITIREAHHVWVDHCDISDGDDGNLDITRESDFITVSWNRFSYTSDDREHRFSNLIGASDDHTQDGDDLRVTLHHNWWAENVSERMPRARYGRIHVFNNYFASPGSNYCVRASTDANLRIENNYFDGVDTPIDPNVHAGAMVEATGNISTAGGLYELSQGRAFQPPYTFTPDDAADVPALVQSGAGPS